MLDVSHHHNCYKLIGINLSEQKNTTLSQQINFTGKLEEDDGATIFFIDKKQQKKLKFFFRLLIVRE